MDQQPTAPMAPKQPLIAPWLLILFIIILLAGGGYWGWWYYSNYKTTTPTTAPTPTEQNTLLLTYKVSGGLGGTKNSLTIDNLGNVNYQDLKDSAASKKYELSATDLSKLNNLLQQIKPENLKSDYNCTQLNCALDYPTATLILGSKTITWAKMDESAPQNIKDLVTFLDNLGTTTTTTPTTSTDLTYTNTATYGFTLTFPAAWKGYKFKEAAISGSTMTHYVEIPTTDAAATGDSTADAGYYSPFAISVYTLAQWATVEASEGPKDTLITKNATYAFAWSHANGVPPTDFTKDSDIAGIIASFKLK